MPFRDPDQKRAYQREWLEKRRAQWIAESGPCVDCGTWEGLQVDHVNAATKITHRIWSWSAARRRAELAKCVTRCPPCHRSKTFGNHENARGERIASSKLTEDDIRAIKRCTLRPFRLIAEQYDVDASLIGYIIRGKIWKHVA